MRKILVFLILIIILTGCSSKSDLANLFSEVKNTDYADITIKGAASFNIPENLAANEFEAELIEKAKNIQYYMNYKQIPTLNYLDGDIILPSSFYNFSIYSNSQETLAFNGDGWYKFDNFSLNEDEYLKKVHEAIEAILSDKNNYNMSERSQGINFNDVAYKTKMSIIEVTEEARNKISNKKMKVEHLKLQTFTNKNKLMVTQYDVILSFPTEFEEDITISLKGEILYDSYGEQGVEIYEPEFNKVYDNMYDFLIELMIEQGS